MTRPLLAPAARPAASGAVGRAWAQARRTERACLVLAAVLAASGLFHLAVLAVDGGPWEGPVSWRKPATFGLSFGLTLAAVARVSAPLRLGVRLRTVLLGVLAADSLVEVGGITLQAWRRVPSHVDMETPFDSAVSMTLAVGGAVLVGVLGALAVPALRGRADAPPDMRLALRAGFASLLIGLVSGAVMIARGVVLVRAGHQQEAYHAVGFLKPVHGVALHGVLVLPALARLLAAAGWDTARRTRAVAAASAGYGVLLAAALGLSLLG
ncbi:hypothetical protein [Streptomyces sp. NPDC001380]|uniref:hypothetical protein n=1 Tax=Streptomyces sp. NPDC001380 TaxID=3364566 RepID=UPI0036A0A186